MAANAPAEVYVWVWLPGATEPVVAGRLEQLGGVVFFNYGRSYLARDNAISLYEPELPLRAGRIRPHPSLWVPGCITDAGPDSWGRRVILQQVTGHAGRDADLDELSLLTYLLASGSDRIGGLDFQASATEYVPRVGGATLDELAEAAQRVQAGEPLSAELDAALLHGTSIGGARPKATLRQGDRQWIAKFSSSTDPYPVVLAEAVAMRLAVSVGLDVAHTDVTRVLGRDVLLVERFDRTSVPGERRIMVSALTMLQLDEMMGRYATYPDFAEVIRTRFTDPAATLRELFSRIVFNICVGNTDDHARNHAAFWDGTQLALTPAYDLCPQLRGGREVNQAMAIGPDGFRRSQLRGAISAAATYLLSPGEAQEIVQHIVDGIRREWTVASDAVGLTRAEREAMWERQILNPYIFEAE